MSTDLYMRIGSETKTFTVTALLQLVDQRKVRLHDPISKYVAGVPDGNAITLRDLAEMRSGLFDYLRDPAFLSVPGSPTSAGNGHPGSCSPTASADHWYSRRAPATTT